MALAMIVSSANAIVTATKALRANASDIWLVSIISVETKASSELGDPCVTLFYVSGRVLDVNVTSTYAKHGDRVTFGSYSVDTESVNCLGYAGPLPPPKLEPGWCGLVYLNPSDEGVLYPAAYGYSFVPEPDESECPDVPVKASERGDGSKTTREVFVDDGKDDLGIVHKSRARTVSLRVAWTAILFLIM